MKKILKLLILLQLSLLTLAACDNSFNASSEISDMPQIEYGYANAAGDKIIVLLADIDDMNNNRLLTYFDFAIGENGKSYKIEYLTYQESGEKNNHRDLMQNFDQQAGCVYKVIDSPAVPNNTYILLSNEEHKKYTLLQEKDTQETTLTSNELLSKYTELAGRKAINGWILSLYQNGIRISMIEFESVDSDLLAWMVLEDEDIFRYCEFPAKIDDSYTGWAMGDQGNLNDGNNRFRMLCALQNDRGIVVYFSWYGEEGEVIKKVDFLSGEYPKENTVSGRYLLM